MAVGFPPQTDLLIPLGRMSSEAYLEASQAAFEQLGWRIVHFTHCEIHAIVPLSAYSVGEVFRVLTDEQGAQLSSRCMALQPFDFGKNDRNIERFMAVLESLQQPAHAPVLRLHKIEESKRTPKTHGRRLPKLQRPIPRTPLREGLLPGGRLLATPLLLYANMIGFIVLLANGIDPIFPQVEQLVELGANYKPSVLSGEYWRLLVSCFIHIGVVHLLVNSLALLFVGSMLEPLLGAGRFTLVYVSSGIAASTASVWWNENIVSAGASGAIFGLLGLLLIMAGTNYLPRQQRKHILTGLTILAAYMVVQGTEPSIDNAAHIGGLLAGLASGLALFPAIQRPAHFKTTFATGLAVVAIGIGSAAVLLRGTPNYYSEYDALMAQFSENEQRGMNIFRMPSNASRSDMLTEVQYNGLGFWEDNLEILNEIEAIDDLPEELRERTRIMKQYCKLRLSTLQLITLAIQEQTDRYDQLISERNNQLEAVLDSLNDAH